MPLRRVVGRALQLDANVGVQHHKLLELFRDERPLRTEGRPRESENRFVLVVGLLASTEKCRGHHEVKKAPR